MKRAVSRVLAAAAVVLAATAPVAAMDPRQEWPNPSMTNAELSKSCSAEASRVHKRTRSFRAESSATVLKEYRRQYRRDCVQRVKRQRGTVRALG